MEFARLAVGPRPVVVVDAVGQVRRLLDLGDESAGADAVDTPRRQEKDVARSDGMVAQQVADRMVGYRRGIGFGTRRSKPIRRLAPPVSETTYHISVLPCIR